MFLHSLVVFFHAVPVFHRMKNQSDSGFKKKTAVYLNPFCTCRFNYLCQCQIKAKLVHLKNHKRICQMSMYDLNSFLLDEVSLVNLLLYFGQWWNGVMFKLTWLLRGYRHCIIHLDLAAQNLVRVNSCYEMIKCCF